jgi:hypothetical protein
VAGGIVAGDFARFEEAKPPPAAPDWSPVHCRRHDIVVTANGAECAIDDCHGGRHRI